MVIVDIGDVLDVGHAVAEKAQVANQHVEGREGEEVTDMRRVVGRDPTDVHTDPPVDGLKSPPLAGIRTG